MKRITGATRRYARARLARLMLLVLPASALACEDGVGDLGTSPHANADPRTGRPTFQMNRGRAARGGMLSVTISDVPPGAAPVVRVAGPASFADSLTSSRSLSGLKPGTYTVDATTFDVGGVRYTPNPASQQLSVGRGVSAAAVVSYAPVAPSAGSLTVAVTGLPDGVGAAVTVTGPNAFTASIGATEALGGLAAGDYAIAAAGVTVGGVTYIATPASQVATVRASAAASVGVTYAAQTPASTPTPPTPVAPSTPSEPSTPTAPATAPAPTTGGLAVSVIGLPAGGSSSVAIGGPDGFSQTLAASRTFDAMAPGTYSLAARSVTADATTYAPSPATQTVTVEAGVTASAAVTYAVVSQPAPAPAPQPMPTPTPTPTPSPAPVPSGGPRTLGTLRVLALMAQFQDEPTPDLPAAVVSDAISQRLGGYIADNSYGRANVTVQVTGWVVVPGYSDPNTYYWSEQAAFEQAAARAAAGQGVNFDQFDYLILVNSGVKSYGETFIVPTGSGGTRNIPGVVLRSGDLYVSGSVKTYVLVHEFGHAMGLGHAGTVDCGAQVFCAINDATNWREYGSTMSVMGAGFGQLTADHKDMLGWFGASGLATVTADGTYTLEPYETATGGVKALRIPRGGSDYLYLEYRQPIGMDANWLGGVVMHVKKDATTSAELASYPLNMGTPATDPATGATVSIVSASSSGVTIKISGLRAP